MYSRLRKAPTLRVLLISVLVPSLLFVALLPERINLQHYDGLDSIVFVPFFLDEIRRICIVEFDGSETRCLTDERTATAHDPIWSPDKSQIAFVSNGVLFVIHQDGSNLRQVTHAQFLSDVKTEHKWSPDGKTLLFVAGNSTHNMTIYKVDIDTTTQEVLIGDKNQNGSPDWSPDGRQVVFGSFNEVTHICLLDVSAGNIRQLTTGDGSFGIPIWSPEGKHIANLGVMPNERGEYDFGEAHVKLYIMDADGANPHELADTRASVPLRFGWAPDGTKIAFVRREGDRGREYNVYTVNIYDASVQRLTDGGTNYYQDWSPDGEFIAFSSLAEDGWELNVMNEDGTNARHLADCGIQWCNADWR